MIVNLRESKARLSELVESASQGEDVLITVRGKIRARLTRAIDTDHVDMAQWAEELRRQIGSPCHGQSIEFWLDQDRQEREL